MSLFEAQSTLMLAALGKELGCDPAAFSSHRLTVVARPPGHPEELVVHAVDTGLGTVLNVPASLSDWVLQNAPADHHFRALQPFFLASLAERAREAGYAGATAHGFSLSFALNVPLAAAALPDGHRLVEVGRDWMDRYRPTNEFDNALGEPHEADRFERTRTAYVLFDAAEEALAVAAIWDEHHGREEIGVDVRRSMRGRGYAKIVVARATQDILAAGRIPYYSCGATNIRSHRNAIACGFLPLYISGAVYSERRAAP